MNLRLSAYIGIRVVASAVLSVLLAFTIFKLAEVRSLESSVAPVFNAWWTTGRYVALGLSQVLPQDWIHGAPKSETYWPAASAAGFVLVSAVVAWTVIIFAIWLALGRYVWPKLRHRSNHAAAAASRS